MKTSRRDRMPEHRTFIAASDIGWWGWTEWPPPEAPVRMHLRCFTDRISPVDLEGANGARAFRPPSDMSSAVAARLVPEVHALRAELDECWLHRIRQWGWIRFEDRRVVVYPDSPLQFVRDLPIVGVRADTLPDAVLAPLIWRG